MERTLEKILYNSRWLLVPIYFGLVILLVMLTLNFIVDLVALVPQVLVWSEKEAILATLALVDLALVASLVIMVIISGYENFISKIEVGTGEERLSWLGKLDSGTLKLKIASSIVAISSIHLLKAFMSVQEIPNDKLLWLVIIHITFVVSALLMAVIERFLLVHSENQEPRGASAD
ncbi:TIGR00645 family protein [Maritimibacter sp. DP07]|uniref:UPF0114 protein GQE99_00050 n=1 Tax=Maritimibacter harenae TaxID=2606218 RepID=A0A845M515_9RHOB|nr:TIGR00645 family protein [Maritimibacter harenae]MZR11424.1 TIGR00645 family protein [Maritimibacter harenae]